MPPPYARPCKLWFCPVHSFGLLALLVGLGSVFLVPPRQVNDEAAHVARVAQILQGKLLPGTAREVSVSATLSRFIADFSAVKDAIRDRAKATGEFPHNAYRFGDFFAPQYIRTDQDAHGTIDAGNARIYPPVAYSGQILGVALAQAVSDHAATGFYAGRVGALLVACALLMLGLHLLPGYKLALGFLALTPMIVVTRGSFSVDSMTNALAFLTFALACRYAWDARARIGRAELAWFTAALTLTALCKPPLIALVLLYWLIPGAKFPSPGYRWLGFALILLCAGGITAGWWGGVTALHGADITGTAESDMTARLLQLWQHPLAFLWLMTETIPVMAGEWVRQFIGSYFNHDGRLVLTLYLPPFALACYGVALALALWLSDAPAPVTHVQRGIAAATLLAVYGAMAGLFALSYGLHHAHIAGIQGRYFHAVAPLLAILLIPTRGEYVPAVLNSPRRHALVWCATLFMNLLAMSYTYRLNYDSL